MNLLAGTLDTHAPPWTAGASCPGGICRKGSLAVFLRTLERRYPWLPRAAPPLRARLRHARGRVLGGATSLGELGTEMLPHLYEREVEYLCREEFARTAQDILWRRSKLGLHLLQVDAAPLERWLQRHTASGAAGGLPAVGVV